MKIIKILLFIAIIFILLLVVNYARIALSYYFQKNQFEDKFEIYGYKDSYVPQAITYSSKYNVILQTSYNSKNKCSKIFITDFETGKLIKELELLKNNGDSNLNHVGGITTDDNTIWISGDYELNWYSLDEIMNTNLQYIKSILDLKLHNRGDFCLFKDNVLWIGDFYLKFLYNVPENNPLLIGYSIDANYNSLNPRYLISIPKMVQGLAITDDNSFVFTRSYSGFLKSEVLIYKNFLNTKSDYYELDGIKVPYYKFTKNNLIDNIKIPPMAEGLFFKDKSLYILFESCASRYFTTYPKINKILKISNIKI